MNLGIDMDECMVLVGSFELTPIGTSGRVIITWHHNPNLKMTREEQLYHNRLVDPNFEQVVIKEV